MAKAGDDALAELLDPYRQEEDQSSAALIIGDPDAARILAVWKTLPPPRWKRPRGKEPPGFRERWLWLWEGLQPTDEYLDEIAVAAGVSPQVVQPKLTMLISGRLIYPDGTISKQAEAALKAHIASHLRPTPRRRK
jgi:hypothetical protein